MSVLAYVLALGAAWAMVSVNRAHMAVIDVERSLGRLAFSGRLNREEGSDFRPLLALFALAFLVLSIGVVSVNGDDVRKALDDVSHGFFLCALICGNGELLLTLVDEYVRCALPHAPASPGRETPQSAT